MSDIHATHDMHDPHDIPDLHALPVEAALAIVMQRVQQAQQVQPLAIEFVPLRDALDRVLAQDIVSPVNVPAHDNAAMDGYAFDGAALANAPANEKGNALNIHANPRIDAGTEINANTGPNMGANTDAGVNLVTDANTGAHPGNVAIGKEPDKKPDKELDKKSDKTPDKVPDKTPDKKSDETRLSLAIAGKALAGHPFVSEIAPGACVRIMTGAPMPAGCDTVIPQEYVALAGDAACGTVSFFATAIARGANRRRAGEDLAAGSVALRAGRILRAADIGLIASLGIAHVGVRRRLRVAFFSTGDELCSPGDPTDAGPNDGPRAHRHIHRIYDSNRYTLHAMLRRLNVDTLDLGIVRDEPGALAATLREAAREADVVLASGGISVGEADFTRAQWQALGEVAFWGLAMRPGRPLVFGQTHGQTHDQARDRMHDQTHNQMMHDHPHDRTHDQPHSQQTHGQTHARPRAQTYEQTREQPYAQAHKQPHEQPRSQTQTGAPTRPTFFFGLPGNPVATMVAFYQIVRPALLALAFAQPQPVPLIPALSDAPLNKRAGRTEFLRGIATRDARGQWRVAPTGSQSSSALATMSTANCFIVLAHERARVSAGESVDIMLFDVLV